MSDISHQVTSRQSRVAVDILTRGVEGLAVELGLTIAATPTSLARNALCDANIHLGAAAAKLKEAAALMIAQPAEGA